MVVCCVVAGLTETDPANTLGAGDGRGTVGVGDADIVDLSLSAGGAVIRDVAIDTGADSGVTQTVSHTTVRVSRTGVT